jgi:hypothetical protein
MSIKSLKSMKNRTNNKKKEETAQGVENKAADLTDSPQLKSVNSGVKFMEKEPLENCVRRVIAHLQATITKIFTLFN